MEYPFGRLVTAMITPFTADGEIDWEAVDRLVEHLLAQRSEGILVAGTTGESPTLSDEEKIALFRRVKERLRGRGFLLAGTGSNDTAHTVELSQATEEAGADGLLVVTPYYNRPSQEGLYRHFRAVAESTRLPVIVYNIPGRTGVYMEVDTLLRLAELPNVVGVKDSSGRLADLARLVARAPAHFRVYGGDDAMFLPLLAIGGYGLISVASHLVGREIRKMLDAFLEGRVVEAAAIHRRYLPLFEGLLSLSTNPVPLKAALALRRIASEHLRLPLVPLNEEGKRRLALLLEEVGA